MNISLFYTSKKNKRGIQLYRCAHSLPVSAESAENGSSALRSLRKKRQQVFITENHRMLCKKNSCSTTGIN
jgi:hypothetical protein